MEKVHLRRSRRILQGHLWVFSNELEESPRKYEPGSLVGIYDQKEQFLGIGYINPNSLIAIRILTRQHEAVDKEFFRKKIAAALDLRKRICQNRDSFRLIYSEGDFLPGLIVDKYGDCLVLQILTYGMEMFRDVIIELLDDIFTPNCIVVRNDSSVRALEGLPLHREIVKGTIPPYPVITENGLRFEVDPFEGQKTGFFLDQRDNRLQLKDFVMGGTGLDLFCYMGAWSIHLASRGAEVICVDSSERALQKAKRNAELNDLQSLLSFAKADVFTFLDEELTRSAGKYDFIMLDPPAFVKSQGRLKEAIKAYQSINQSAMKLLKRGGILATSSCSYHLGKEAFLEMLRLAAKASGRHVRLISMRSQGPDHPILLSMPETEYLKCAFLVVD